MSWGYPGWRRVAAIGLISGVAALAVPALASATPVVERYVIGATDYKVFGFGGVGSSASGGGNATIAVSGINGPVSHAYLTWNGIGDPAVGGPYSAATIQVNGHNVTGTTQGESGSNCWGPQETSRTYLADVTSLVTAAGGNGTYTLTGLGPGGQSGNGGHLVITYNDGVTANYRDLYLYYGNDSNSQLIDQFPGATSNGWNDSLPGIKYAGGSANLTLAVSDGQNFGPGDDGTVTVTGPGGTVNFPDETGTYNGFDGTTVPDMGHSRAPNGSLYDLQSYDVTSTFTGSGVQGLTLTAPLVDDCLAITMAAVDVQAAPPPLPGVSPTVSINPESTTEPATGTKKGSMLIKLSQPSSSPVTVTVQTADGTATSPEDYQASTQTVTIPAGQTIGKALFTINSDPYTGQNEYFYATITSVSAPYTIGTPTAVFTILQGTSSTSAAPLLAPRASLAPTPSGGGEVPQP